MRWIAQTFVLLSLAGCQALGWDSQPTAEDLLASAIASLEDLPAQRAIDQHILVETSFGGSAWTPYVQAQVHRAGDGRWRAQRTERSETGSAPWTMTSVNDGTAVWVDDLREGRHAVTRHALDELSSNVLGFRTLEDLVEHLRDARIDSLAPGPAGAEATWSLSGTVKPHVPYAPGALPITLKLDRPGGRLVSSRIAGPLADTVRLTIEVRVVDAREGAFTFEAPESGQVDQAEGD